MLSKEFEKTIVVKTLETIKEHEHELLTIRNESANLIEYHPPRYLAFAIKHYSQPIICYFTIKKIIFLEHVNGTMIMMELSRSDGTKEKFVIAIKSNLDYKFSYDIEGYNGIRIYVKIILTWLFNIEDLD